MQSEGTIFLRYASAPTKKAIRCSRSTPFLSVLEQGLHAFSLEHSTPNCTSHYALKWQSAFLDLGNCIQFSNVPFGSTLDIVIKRSVRPAPSPIKVCLQEMQSGKRSILLLRSDRELVLWQVLRLFEALNGSVICKEGFEVRLEAAGNGMNLGLDQLMSILGSSNILLRLSFAKKSAVDFVLPMLQQPAESFLHTEQPGPKVELEKMMIESKNEDQITSEVQLPNADPLSYSVLETLPHIDSPNLPDSYYEFSLAELKDLASSNARKQDQAENMPLTSCTLKNQKREQELRSKYSQCTLRIRLPASSADAKAAAIDVVFPTAQKIEALFGFLKGQESVLFGGGGGAVEDYAFVVPNQVSDLWALRGMSFFEAGLYPGALVIASNKSK